MAMTGAPLSYLAMNGCALVIGLVFLALLSKSRLGHPRSAHPALECSRPRSLAMAAARLLDMRSACWRCLRAAAHMPLSRRARSPAPLRAHSTATFLSGACDDFRKICGNLEIAPNPPVVAQTAKPPNRYWLLALLVVCGVNLGWA
jgi:hypothetical protein